MIDITRFPLGTDRSVAERATAFLDCLFPPPRRFGMRLWNGTRLPSDGTDGWTMVIRSPGALKRMFRPPLELSLGEAFVRGDIAIEGEITGVFDIVEACRELTASPRRLARVAGAYLLLPGQENGARETSESDLIAALRGRPHSRSRDRAAIRHHYDVGNEFYELFLDPRMIYSCAYFPHGDEDLATAQERKLEHICRKLRLQPGERLLDIGCGWGGLLIYAAEKYGIHGVGVTLSAEQEKLARERVPRAGLDARIEIRLQDYRDVVDEPFDKLVSVGMFEHVGRAHLPEYFAHTQRLLAPGGLFLNHGISKRPPAKNGVRRAVAEALKRVVVGDSPFRRRYIFPDGELVPLSEVNLVAERTGFEVRDIENLREHYARTLRHWLRRLENRHGDVIRIAGEEIYRAWRLYLAVSGWMFEQAHLSVNQTLLAKPRDGRVDLPLSRADLYR